MNLTAVSQGWLAGWLGPKASGGLMKWKKLLLAHRLIHRRWLCLQTGSSFSKNSYSCGCDVGLWIASRTDDILRIGGPDQRPRPGIFFLFLAVPRRCGGDGEKLWVGWTNSATSGGRFGGRLRESHHTEGKGRKEGRKEGRGVGCWCGGTSRNNGFIAVSKLPTLTYR